MNDITRIGVVKSKFTEPADPLAMRKHESLIRIDKEYKDGLYKIEENEYLQIVFYFHISKEYSLQCTTYSGNFKGVFASRSPKRPSRIGVTTVKLLERKGRELRVKGLDAVDGTPVLDIKPYSSSLDGNEQESIKRTYSKIRDEAIRE
ncbi:MAG: tRNA (N6-threonylcarbamoyladenosine(37)-N6)-methyltransferase TrmO [Euryarchaeota archaeon]|nr:tRNA (N6-threonylcarbamoyladenosine(37)-N6)-methyltransferase TrmO [Euryarchaeota archaeon]